MQENKKKICLISSSGGHFEQLLMLRKLSEEFEIFIVTEKTKSNEYLSDVYKGKTSYLLYGTKKNLFTYFLNCDIIIID